MILIAGYEKGLSLEPFIAEALRAKHIILSVRPSVRIVEARRSCPDVSRS